MPRSGFRLLSLALRQVKAPKASVSPPPGDSDIAETSTLSNTVSTPHTSTKSNTTSSHHSTTKSSPTSTKTSTTTTTTSVRTSGDGSTGGQSGNDGSDTGPPTGSQTTTSDVGASLGGSSSFTSISSQTADFIPPAADTFTTGSESQSSTATAGPSALADHTTGSGILHNKTTSALIFTFSSLLALAVIGLLLYCCHWRRRRDMRHVMLSDEDPDGRVGILRSDSTGSNATRRPMSATSVFSDGHYLPARFAGVPPINRHHGFDTAHIEKDPFSVHRVVYPDPPGNSDDDRRHSYVLYPDPVPPPMPLRVNYPRPPRPPQALAEVVAAAGLLPASVPVEPRTPPRSPTRVRVPTLPPLPPSLSTSSHDHGSDDIDAQSARAQSPDSRYDDDVSYQPPPARTFLIDRRPDTGKRRSQ